MSRQESTVGRVAFLARREAIWSELAKGWSVSAVYRRFSEEVPVCLRQFQIYVKRYLVEKSLPQFVAMAETARERPAGGSSPLSRSPQKAAAPETTTAIPVGFQRNGRSNHNDFY